MAEFTFLLSESVKDTFKNMFLTWGEIPQIKDSDKLHLQKTIDWIEEASVHGDGGVSSHYSLITGDWLYPFPETTGYIIPTLFDYAKFSGNKKYSELAIKLTHWLCDVQLDSGACMQGNYDRRKGKTSPIIFNTGQNILGFIRAFEESGEQKFKESAIKAGDFLVSSTDDKGVWDKNLHRGLKHTINVRCSWSLLMLNQIVANDDYVRVAHANLEWAMAQQQPNGWFKYGTSRIGGLPNTHFLAYTCEGFIESYRITGITQYLDAAIKTASKMLELFDQRKMLYAFWDENWNNRGKRFKFLKGKFVCLTGNIQISRVWMQLYEETKDEKYLDAAFKMLNFVKSLQDVESGKKGIEGGIKGSFPVYGSYSTLMYPNWAAKYFADALLLKIRLSEK